MTWHKQALTKRQRSNARSKHNILVYLALVICVFCASGCGALSPSPPPAPTSEGTAAIPLPATPTLLPTTEALQTHTPPSATSIPQSTPIPPSPTIPPCTPLANWPIYVVQKGDNLYRLSLKTGTTVGQLKQANCLDTDTIYVGQKLHLPYLPALPTISAPSATVTTPPPETKEPTCESPFDKDCSPLADTLLVDPGGPDNSTYIPCAIPGFGPRVEIDDLETLLVHLGQRRYFFVCEFPDTPTTVTVTRSDGFVENNIALTQYHPNLDLQNTAQYADVVIAWYALPFYPTGTYKITVIGDGGTQAELQFTVSPPPAATQYILTVPLVGPRGIAFDVYYVNFDLGPLTITLYGEDNPATGRQHDMSARSSWNTLIDQPLDNGKGWTHQSLISASTDTPAAYSLTANDKDVKNLFWLE